MSSGLGGLIRVSRALRRVTIVVGQERIPPIN